MKSCESCTGCATESLNPAKEFCEVQAGLQALRSEVLDIAGSSVPHKKGSTGEDNPEYHAFVEHIERVLRDIDGFEQRGTEAVQGAYQAACAMYEEGGEVYWPNESRIESIPSVIPGHEGADAIMFGKKGARIPLTVGDVAVAPMWNHEYRFAHAVHKDLIMRYLDERRDHARHMLDAQVWLMRQALDITLFSSPGHRAHMNMMHERTEMPEGLTAEHMTVSVFKKLCIDANLSFTIDEVPLQEDVEEKVDFVIHLKGHARGAGTLVAKNVKDIAVQFTIAEGKRQEKEAQLTRHEHNMHAQGVRPKYDSHVLVTFPLAHVRQLHVAWHENHQRKPGGPERLLAPEKVEELFRGVLQQLPPGLLDIEEEWRKAREVIDQGRWSV